RLLRSDVERLVGSGLLIWRNILHHSKRIVTPGRSVGPASRATVGTRSISIRSGKLRRRRSWLEGDLRAKESLGKRVVDVLHQIHEHVVRLVLVLDERVLLAPRSVADGVPQLVEIVEMI